MPITLNEFLRKKGLSPGMATITRARFQSLARLGKKLPAPVERRGPPIRRDACVPICRKLATAGDRGRLEVCPLRGLRATMPKAQHENTIRDRAELMASIVSSHKGWDTMTSAEKRVLVEMVFGGKTTLNTQREWEEAKSRGEEPMPVERRMGVFVGWVPGEEKKKRGKVFDYCISGHLIDQAHERL